MRTRRAKEPDWSKSTSSSFCKSKHLFDARRIDDEERCGAHAHFVMPASSTARTSWSSYATISFGAREAGDVPSSFGSLSFSLSLSLSFRGNLGVYF